MVNTVKELRAKLVELDEYEAQIKEERKFLKKREKTLLKILTPEELKELEETETATAVTCEEPDTAENAN